MVFNHSFLNLYSIKYCVDFSKFGAMTVNRNRGEKNQKTCRRLVRCDGSQRSQSLILFHKSVVPREQKIYTVTVYIIIMKKSSTEAIKFYKYLLFFLIFFIVFYEQFHEKSKFHDFSTKSVENTVLLLINLGSLRKNGREKEKMRRSDPILNF